MLDKESAPRVLEGALVLPEGARFALVASRFNHFIVDRLVEGAVDAIVRHGGSAGRITIARVPGAWELPLVARRLAARSAFDAVVVLGAVIRGATPHFDIVAGDVASALASTALQTGVPITLGLLTTDTIEQAIERAGTKVGNKGWDAALSAIEMVTLGKVLERLEL
jgi:6,7-dimethyl-8-ribityllumazine synthase